MAMLGGSDSSRLLLAEQCEESAEPESAAIAAPVTPSPVSAAAAPPPPAPHMSHHLDPLAEFSLGGEPENWCDALLCMDDAGLPDSSLLANLDQLGCGVGVGDWAPPRFFLQPEINEVSTSASSGSSGKRVRREVEWQPENSSQEDSSAPSASGPRPAKRVCVEQGQPTAAAARAAAPVPAASKLEAMPAAKLEPLSPASPAADVEAAALASPFEEDDNDNENDNEGENEGESPPALAVGADGAKMSPVLEPAKPRQKRGTATDPQSLAARARRERISRKLRTLQTLVPNGNRLDTATMLDQAIEYVRFLQLQLRNKNSGHYALVVGGHAAGPAAARGPVAGGAAAAAKNDNGEEPLPPGLATATDAQLLSQGPKQSAAAAAAGSVSTAEEGVDSPHVREQIKRLKETTVGKRVRPGSPTRAACQFDEGKRSCRRRLLGHNRRRRKPKGQTLGATSSAPQSKGDQLNLFPGQAQFPPVRLKDLEDAGGRPQNFASEKDNGVAAAATTAAGSSGSGSKLEPESLLRALSRPVPDRLGLYLHSQQKGDGPAAASYSAADGGPSQQQQLHDEAAPGWALSLAGPSTSGGGAYRHPAAQPGAAQLPLNGMGGPHTPPSAGHGPPFAEPDPRSIFLPSQLSGLQPAYVKGGSDGLPPAPSSQALTGMQLFPPAQSQSHSQSQSQGQELRLPAGGGTDAGLLQGQLLGQLLRRPELDNHQIAELLSHSSEGRALLAAIQAKDRHLEMGALLPHEQQQVPGLSSGWPAQPPFSAHSAATHKQPAEAYRFPRTSRISLKLFEKNPEDLPLNLRNQIVEWLATSPQDLESYIRPGCLLLTIYAALPKQRWDELQNDIEFSLQRLLHAEGSAQWLHEKILCQVDRHLASACCGKLESVTPLEQNDTPYISRIRPLAICPGEEAEVTIVGNNLSLPGSRVLLAYQGGYVCADIEGPQELPEAQEDPSWDDDGAGEDNAPEDAAISKQCLRLRLPPESAHGRAFIEVENGAGGSNACPLLVVSPEARSQLRELEQVIAMAGVAAEEDGRRRNLPLYLCKALHQEAVDLMEAESTAFLNDLGWVLQKATWFTQRMGHSVSITSHDLAGSPFAVPERQVKRLLDYAAQRGWSHIVQAIASAARVVMVAEDSAPSLTGSPGFIMDAPHCCSTPERQVQVAGRGHDNRKSSLASVDPGSQSLGWPVIAARQEDRSSASEPSYVALEMSSALNWVSAEARGRAAAAAEVGTAARGPGLLSQAKALLDVALSRPRNVQLPEGGVGLPDGGQCKDGNIIAEEGRTTAQPGHAVVLVKHAAAQAQAKHAVGRRRPLLILTAAVASVCSILCIMLLDIPGWFCIDCDVDADEGDLESHNVGEWQAWVTVLAAQCKVAHKVQQLVPHGLLGVAQWWVEPPPLLAAGDGSRRRTSGPA
eukprot:SM000253S09027  [mRNA]  locus=s253:131293:145484:+ [translate_table: standard]